MKRMTLRLEDDRYDALNITRVPEHRSLNSEIEAAIDYYLQNSPDAKETLKKAEQEKVKKSR